MTRAHLALFSLLVLAACVGREARLDTAADIARQGGLQPITVAGQPFALAAFVRDPDPAQPVVVYIEGDGLAWVSSSLPSTDPTPRNPVGLRLAALDTSPNVVYLARPCQYAWSPSCSEAYWTNKRFADEVVRATSLAIDRLIRPGQQIHLVGYSGGGAIAALLAARRADVVSLRTVAGNLDHEAVNRYHGVSPMRESLNPKDIASRLKGLPQQHLVGLGDKVVPPFIAQAFTQAVGDEQCVAVIPVRNATHGDGWEPVWRSYSSSPPTCRTSVRH
ncbi:MAG: alpha/beta hydrolase [Magnetospirillum sp.]|nr:alpha/beta hydrolase [Magnetospirillum sp.]